MTKTGTPALLVLNKIDLVKDKARLLPLIEQYRALHEFADYLPISAAKAKGSTSCARRSSSGCPKGPRIFPRTTSPISRSAFWPPN